MRHIPVSWISEVPAGCLPATLQQMTDKNARGKMVPIIPLPSEVSDRRSKDEGWIGNSSSHDAVNALGQSFGNRLRAQIGIDSDDLPDVLNQ